MKVILGGGIGGLSAAYYLRNKFPRDTIKLYESSNHIGGWIKSRKLPNGTIFEQGPRTLRPKGEAGHNTLQLIDEIGLADQIKPIYSTHPAAKNRMIFANGKLHILPSSLQDIFVKHSPFSKPLIYYILKDLTAKRKDIRDNDESIYSFVERRFGNDIARYAISPMICGICAGNAKEISVKFLMKSIFEKEQKYGGVIKGVLYDLIKNGATKIKNFPTTLVDQAVNEKWSIYSFNDGIEILPKKLKEILNEDKIELLTNHTCDKIEFSNNAVITINGEQNKCEHIISSLPAQNLAKLLDEQHPDLSKYLLDIPCVDVAVVNLQYKDNLNPYDAFGFLVPPSENLPILGVIFDSCCFPNENGGTVFTVMMGGHWFNKLFGENPKDELILNTATEQIKNIMKINQPPDNYKISILRNCIPQYIVGHNDSVSKIENYIQQKKLPLSICGSSYYGVGVNDVILSAKNCVETIQT